MRFKEDVLLLRPPLSFGYKISWTVAILYAHISVVSKRAMWSTCHRLLCIATRGTFSFSLFQLPSPAPHAFYFALSPQCSEILSQFSLPHPCIV